MSDSTSPRKSKTALAAHWRLAAAVALGLAAPAIGLADAPTTLPAAQAATEPTTEPAPPLPSEAVLKQMVTQSLLDFNAGLRAKDFADFHDHQVAAAFAQQVSAADFLRSFQGFIDRGIDIAFIAKSAPIFDGKVRFDGDIITATGHYQTKPLRVRFRLLYYHEKGVWRLAGINVNVYPAASEPPPKTQPSSQPATQPA